MNKLKKLMVYLVIFIHMMFMLFSALMNIYIDSIGFVLYFGLIIYIIYDAYKEVLL